MVVFASQAYRFGLTSQLQSTISHFYCQMIPVAKQYAPFINSTIPVDIYGDIKAQHNYMTACSRPKRKIFGCWCRQEQE